MKLTFKCNCCCLSLLILANVATAGPTMLGTLMTTSDIGNGDSHLRAHDIGCTAVVHASSDKQNRLIVVAVTMSVLNAILLIIIVLIILSWWKGALGTDSTTAAHTTSYSNNPLHALTKAATDNKPLSKFNARVLSWPILNSISV